MTEYTPETTKRLYRQSDRWNRTRMNIQRNLKRNINVVSHCPSYGFTNCICKILYLKVKRIFQSAILRSNIGQDSSPAERLKRDNENTNS